MHLNIARSNHKWDKSDTYINHWLDERQDLIVALSRLVKMRPFKFKSLIEDDLSEFLTLLIDYVSAGQFQVLETIFEAAKAKPELGLNKQVLIHILENTNEALDFNERYTEENFSLDRLEQDLNTLSEQLARRMEYEDQLIELYVKASDAITQSD